MKLNTLLIVIYFLLFGSQTHAQTAFKIKSFPIQQFSERRQAAMSLYPNDLLLFPSNTRIKSDEQHGFIQNTSFYYFSSLANAVGAVLLLDGPNKKSILFTRPTIGLFPSLEALSIIDNSPRTKDSLGLDTILPFDSLENYINRTLQAFPETRIFSDYQREGIRIQNFNVVKDEWVEWLQNKWQRKIIPPYRALALQEIKSANEIEAMTMASKNAVNGLLSAIKTIKPGIFSRQIEGKIVYECLCNGGNGVYFWPLVLQGNRAVFPDFFRVFSDYSNGSEILKQGELVRLDVGCDFNHYKSDVGRTVPVSGKFSEAQREAYDLLVNGYLASLKLFKDGVSYTSLLDAFRSEIKKHEQSLKTAHGKKAFEFLLSKDGLNNFEVHEMGLGGTEKQVDTLKTGMVLAWEPMFTIDDQSYYLEDLILINKNSFTNLTPGLPYFSGQIEKLMKKK